MSYLDGVSPGVRRTKIVCTIGPASSSEAMVDALVGAGMDAARLNFSHGTHDEHAERAPASSERPRSARAPLALIADLQGPKLRIGELPGPIDLTRGDEVLVSGEGVGRDGDLPVAPPVLSQMLRPGHEVLIDDGLVRLRVDEIDGGGRVRARCSSAARSRRTRA